MTYARKTLSEIKLIHGDYGNFIKGQKLQKDKEKKYKKPPYQDLAASTEIEGETLDEKCWPGYEKKGMKTMFGKRYPNCVKKKKTKKEEFSDWRSELEQIEEKTKLKNTNYGPAVVYQDSEKSVPARVRQMPTGGDGTAYMGEKMDLKKADMGDVIKDFYKSDAPQFEGKTKKERRDMAIAAKLEADGKSLKDEYLPEILDKKDVPHIKKLIKKLKDGSELHAKQSKDLEVALKTENTAIESELLIQDWNKDDIKFTEIETIDIIKAKPLKENTNIDEGFKTRMIAKFGKKLIKNIGKVNPFTKTGAQRVTQSVSKVKKYIPPDKITSQNIQTKSVVNQAKKLVDMSKKPNKGTKAVKVDLSKPIDFDKYLGKTPNKIQKKFGSTKPTGTFTDDLPPVKTVPLSKSQTDLMKKTTPKKIKKKVKKITMKDKMKEIENDPMSKQIKKEIEKETGTKTRKFSQKGGVTKGNENEILSNVKPKPKKPLKDHYDWRNELDEDWQKVNRKDKTDGMSQKAVNAYRKENPGSKLQTAVTKDPKKLKKGSKSAKRRLSFCRRMKGMKKRLTSAKTARDPDSRINKALRRWNC